MKFSIILLLFFCCNKSSVDVGNDIQEISIVLDNHLRNDTNEIIKLVCQEIVPISDNTVKEYLISHRTKYSDFEIEKYFDKSSDTIDSSVIRVLKGKKLISGEKLEYLYSNSKRDDFWTDYSREFGNSGFRKFYKPIYNSDSTKYILFYEECFYKMGSIATLIMVQKKATGAEILEVLINGI